MASIKAYFLSRTSVPMKWVGTAHRAGLPPQRHFAITPRGVDRDELLASVDWQDHDRDGRPLPGTHGEGRQVRVTLRGFTEAIDVLESAARQADPAFFVGQAALVRDTATADEAVVEQRLAELATQEARPNGEPPPMPGSVARFRVFWRAIPNLIPPDLFCTADGNLRARWQHGHDRTLWVNFPADGLLGFSLAIPREGNTGLCKMNARCQQDGDILQVATALGVRCIR